MSAARSHRGWRTWTGSSVESTAPCSYSVLVQRTCVGSLLLVSSQHTHSPFSKVAQSLSVKDWAIWVRGKFVVYIYVCACVCICSCLWCPWFCLTLCASFMCQCICNWHKHTISWHHIQSLLYIFVLIILWLISLIVPLVYNTHNTYKWLHMLLGAHAEGFPLFFSYSTLVFPL